MFHYPPRDLPDVCMPENEGIYFVGREGNSRRNGGRGRYEQSTMTYLKTIIIKSIISLTFAYKSGKHNVALATWQLRVGPLLTRIH